MLVLVLVIDSDDRKITKAVMLLEWPLRQKVHIQELVCLEHENMTWFDFKNYTGVVISIRLV